MTTVDGQPQSYPFGPAHELSVDPRLARLRAEQPVLRIRTPYGGGDAWLITRYADIKTVLTDPRFSRAAAARRGVPRGFLVRPSPNSILTKDTPEHSRLRRLVAKTFNTHSVERMSPRIQQIVDSLLDTMIATGRPANLAYALTWPLPITIICDLLGVPPTDHSLFRTMGRRHPGALQRARSGEGRSGTLRRLHRRSHRAQAYRRPMT